MKCKKLVSLFLSLLLATALAVLGNMQMDAADISRDALAVARQNARENKAEVTFYCGDLWDALPSGAQYDLIVCNPPYLTQNEMGEISVEVAVGALRRAGRA